MDSWASNNNMCCSMGKLMVNGWPEAAYIIPSGPMGQPGILWQPEASPILLWPKATTILNILYLEIHPFASYIYIYIYIYI